MENAYEFLPACNFYVHLLTFLMPAQGRPQELSFGCVYPTALSRNLGITYQSYPALRLFVTNFPRPSPDWLTALELGLRAQHCNVTHALLHESWVASRRRQKKSCREFFLFEQVIMETLFRLHMNECMNELCPTKIDVARLLLNYHI